MASSSISRSHDWKRGIRLRHGLVDRLSTSVSIRLWSRSSSGLSASRGPSSRLCFEVFFFVELTKTFNGTDVLRNGGRARYACVYACAAPGCLSFSTRDPEGKRAPKTGTRRQDTPHTLPRLGERATARLGLPPCTPALHGQSPIQRAGSKDRLHFHHLVRYYEALAAAVHRDCCKRSVPLAPEGEARRGGAVRRDCRVREWRQVGGRIQGIQVFKPGAAQLVLGEMRFAGGDAVKAEHMPERLHRGHEEYAAVARGTN